MAVIIVELCSTWNAFCGANVNRELEVIPEMKYECFELSIKVSM